MLHMVKNASQLKNCTMPMRSICGGIASTSRTMSRTRLPWRRSSRKRCMSSGGSSRVVATDTMTLARKTNAPTANATCTDGGTTPGPASLLTPSQATNHGRLLATQVPMPMIRVCTTKP